MGSATYDWFGALSPRKRQVASALAEGLSIKEIAQRLGISRETAKQHAGELYALAGVHSARELLARRWEQSPTSCAAALLREDHASLDALIASLLRKVQHLAPAAEVRLLPRAEARGKGLEIPCSLSAAQTCLRVVSAAPLAEHVADHIRLLALVASSRAEHLRGQKAVGVAEPRRRPVPPAGAPPKSLPETVALDQAVFELHLLRTTALES
ncbi:MAG: helix-turn-helix domain-containing protein [Terriglobales bacterium]